MHSNNYFWRNYYKEEIDFVADRDGNLYGYEFKWSPKKKLRFNMFGWMYATLQALRL